MVRNFGYEPNLIETRSMILRQAGYVAGRGIIENGSDLIDGVLICNSIPHKKQEWFVTQVMNIHHKLHERW
jgi:hypothetical protein